MPLLSRRADLFHQSLEGAPPVDDEMGALVATASRVPALTGRACAPRPDFVDQLGARLRLEAQTLPARPVRRAAQPPPAGNRPLVLVVGRGLPRALVGAAATVLVASTVVGVASRSALPGTALYPVKQLLDSAAVQLAASGYDRGTTQLAQAQQHISEAVDLVDAGSPDAGSVDEALGNAYDSTLAGQRTLLGLYDRDHDQQALIATQDFSARAIPQLQALRPRVPAASVAGVDRLLALLQLGDEAVARKVAACGSACSAIPQPATGTPGPSSLPSLPRGLPTTGAPGLGLPGGTASLPRLPVPGGSIKVGGGSVGASVPGGSLSVPLPSLSLGGSKASGGSGGAGATVPGVGGAGAGTGGVSASLPGVSASVGAGGITVSPTGGPSIGIPVPDPSPLGGLATGAGGVVGGLPGH